MNSTVFINAVVIIVIVDVRELHKLRLRHSMTTTHMTCYDWHSVATCQLSDAHCCHMGTAISIL